MIISRTLAKARIARGERPGWLAAWGPVGVDALCILLVFALAYGPFSNLVQTFDAPVWAVIAALLALGFIPVQAILILSSLWAAKSRWREDPGDEHP